MRSLLRILSRAAPAGAATPESEAPAARLSVSSAAGETPTAGLIPLDITATLDRAGPAVLRIYAPAFDVPAYEKRLDLSPEATTFWVAVHGHLLPDGPATLRLELSTPTGGLLAEGMVTAWIANPGPLADATRDSLRRGGAPLVIDACDSSLYDYADERLLAWFDGSPDAVEAHLADLQASGEASADDLAALRHFVEHGYLVLPDLIDTDLLGRVNADVDEAISRRLEGYEWGQSQRFHELHRTYPAMRELWAHPQILRMLGLIFDAPPVPYQSLTFVFGSEQGRHQDTVALTPFPAGRMCGVWTALEDVQPDSGELVVLPGSHRLPRVYMKDAGVPKVADNDYDAFGSGVGAIWARLGEGFPRELYRPRAGTVLIWHENLMHGGKVRANREASRKSFVGHYFAQGCIAYHDASGLPALYQRMERPT